jgi:ribosomal protein S1
MVREENEAPTRLEDVESKQHYKGTVIKTTLAGAVVDIGLEVPGVVHISQLQKGSVNRVEDVVDIGQEVDVWIRRVFPKKRRIELSMIEPLPLEWREIKEGMVVKGEVTRLEKYGAFVDIGAERAGLIHISELAHGYIKTPSEVVKEGEEVEARVLKVNRRKKQIKLSLKALEEEPPKSTKKTDKQERKTQPDKPVPTAMEVAMREAMERSQGDENESTGSGGSRGTPTASVDEMGDILSRTLDQQVKNSSS